MCINISKKNFPVPILYTNCRFKVGLLKVDNYTGDKWLIHDTKHHKGHLL